MAYFVLAQAVFVALYLVSTVRLTSRALHKTPLTRPATSSDMSDMRFKVPATDAPFCSPDYVQTIQDAVGAKNPPQLSFDQLLWINTLVQTSAIAVTTLSGTAHNFLVWGLGYDSPIWDNANCIPVGLGARGAARPRAANITRTVFIENWMDWVTKVKGKHPALEVVHFDKYLTSMATADEFFMSPYLLPLPDNVDSHCWHVVLVGE
jgi:hypothetical protein